MKSGLFGVGDVIRRKSRPDAVGVIRDKGYLQEATGDWIYRVQFGNATRGVAENDLESLPTDSTPWDDIRENRLAGDSAFRSLMTFERLRRPPSPIAASFGSAKATFYPFQFKPLLKFLENPRKRLLIADDVGLGKTIEAGYIIRELKSRTSLDRMLLVVPSRLRTKWKDEMERRFCESFDVVSARDLLTWKLSLESNRGLNRFSWIISLESARNRDVIAFLGEVQPAFDIVVVDEAHRMRNPDTLQHRLGKALSACADHMLMLTATPVQTSLENLFRLLNILDPFEFRDGNLFEEQCEANRPIVRATTAIRRNPPAKAAALESLNSMRSNEHTRSLTQTEYFSKLTSRCEAATSLDRSELVELQRDINELSLTGKIISRTRKVDVIENPPIRKPFVISVRYSPTEQEFYDSVAELCAIVHPDHYGWGQAMAALQAYRAAASCIPAAAGQFQARLESRQSLFHRISDGFSEAQDTSAAFAEVRGFNEFSVESELNRITSALHRLTEEDTKYAGLRRKLRNIWREDKDNGDPPRKVVIFSFFKPTLRYLRERLTRDGVDCRLINGDIAIPARETRIGEFAENPAVRILLSSEVGSEGLDLQFAAVVVNYDLPWNPMVVEQRIGRLDRIGQRADKIIILNLVAEGTIEDRILYRLYRRIGIFENTIGEIDPILGERVENLASLALRGELSPEDQKSRADQAADATKDQRLQAESLANSADSLMAADQSFLDEIEGLIGRRKVPSSREIYAYVAKFLSDRFAGSRFPQSLITQVEEIRTPPGAGQLVLKAGGSDPEAIRFGRMIETGTVKATFDQDAAIRHPNAELLHSRHPLVKMVTSERERNRDTSARSFALAMRSADLVDAAVGIVGDYAFEIHRFEMEGVRPRAWLVPVFFDGENPPLEEIVSEDLLLSMLTSATLLEPVPSLEEVLVEKLRFRLEEHIASIRGQVSTREIDLNKVRLERRRTTLASALNHRIEEAQARLETLNAKGAAPFAIRMAEAKVGHALRERDANLGLLRDGVDARLETELLVAGILHIESGH